MLHLSYGQGYGQGVLDKVMMLFCTLKHTPNTGPAFEGRYAGDDVVYRMLHTCMTTIDGHVMAVSDGQHMYGKFNIMLIVTHEHMKASGQSHHM